MIQFRSNMKIGLFVRKDLIENNFSNYLKEKVLSCGFEIDNKEPEVVIVAGGDGTFLRAVHHYLDKINEIKFIGINKGSLGFFSSYEGEEVDRLLADLLSDELESASFKLLEASFNGNFIYAVNEIRIENPFHTQISDVYINNEFLETFRGNGLVVSSSMGSSAYNKSLGGAVVLPNLEVLQLSEIAPINNKMYRPLSSSLICDENSIITFKGDLSSVVLGFDHEIMEIDDDLREINFSLSNKKVTLLSKPGHSHISILNKAFINNL